MKALSMKQPWAGLLVRGIKKVETRSWRTSHRGILYIHASMNIDSSPEDWVKEFHPYIIAHEHDFPQGAIIGYVKLIGCMIAKDYKTICHIEDETWHLFLKTDWERESILGNLSLTENRWAWICENPVMFKTPIHCKGALSVWNIPKDIEEKIKLQL